MMWNWLSQLCSLKSQSKRKRVQIDIPIEQSRHSGFAASLAKEYKNKGKDKGSK